MVHEQILFTDASKLFCL